MWRFPLLVWEGSSHNLFGSQINRHQNIFFDFCANTYRIPTTVDVAHMNADATTDLRFEGPPTPPPSPFKLDAIVQMPPLDTGLLLTRLQRVRVDRGVAGDLDYGGARPNLRTQYCDRDHGPSE